MNDDEPDLYDYIKNKAVPVGEGLQPKSERRIERRGIETSGTPPVVSGVSSTADKRWSHDDGSYWPAHPTVNSLPPAFYTVISTPAGIRLQRKTIASDNLMRLADSSSDEVIHEFKTFWTLRDSFKQRGFLHKRGILLWGPPGCLGRETRIHYQAFVDGKRSFKKDVSIERLYQLFHGTPGLGKGRYQTLSPGTEIRISSVDDEGRIVSNVVTDVIKSGIKPVYRVTTAGGKSIIATLDHRFLCNGRYARLETLRPGDLVEIHNNTPVNVSDNEGRQTGRKLCYVKHHPTARTKTVNEKYTYKVLPNARAVVEAGMNNLTLEEYILRLNDCALDGLIFLDTDKDVHHIDENCMNDDPCNLAVFSHRDHARYHGLEQSLYFVTTADKIEEIDFVGEQETYDIEMKAPYHNFVAADFVVHNSGKTASLLLMSNDIVRDDGIVVQIEHPGLATAGLEMIRKIEPTRPVVALLEDLDALVDSYGENNFLSLLDGETQIDGIVYIATSNYPEKLDKRFWDRPSRFDMIKYIGMPSVEARRQYLSAKEPILKGDVLEEWVSKTEGFSIAHLRELIILVMCYGKELKEAIWRLEKMRIKPTSDDSPDKTQFGFYK